MLLEIFIAIFLGLLFGVITGLIPGIHPNLVSTLLLASSPFLLNITSPLIVAVFITTMAISNTYLNNLPAVYLGAPDSETILSVLPAHRLLLQGRGHEAIVWMGISALFCLILTIIATPLLLLIIPSLYLLLKKYIGYILILAVSFLILRESKSKTWALICFLISGVFGIATFNFHPLSEPLFPLLSGMFGLSSLFLSLKENIKIPEQEITQIKTTQNIQKPIWITIITGIFFSLFPGLGPSQAAIISSQLIKNITTEQFLIITGGLNTVNMLTSFITLYTIDKARNGAIVVMSQILQTFNMKYLILLLGVCLIAGGLSTILTIKISKMFSSLITKINYQKLCWSVIIFIVIITILLTNVQGLFILAISTFIGFIPVVKGIGRSHLMGCLLLPIILYFLL